MPRKHDVHRRGNFVHVLRDYGTLRFWFWFGLRFWLWLWLWLWLWFWLRLWFWLWIWFWFWFWFWLWLIRRASYSVLLIFVRER